MSDDNYANNNSDHKVNENQGTPSSDNHHTTGSNLQQVPQQPMQPPFVQDRQQQSVPPQPYMQQQTYYQQPNYVQQQHTHTQQQQMHTQQQQMHTRQPNYTQQPPVYAQQQFYYQQHQGAAPYYGQMPPNQPIQPMYKDIKRLKTNGFAITGMVIGIVSLFLDFIGIFTGLTALVFSILAIRKINKNVEAETGRNLAITGLICGSLAVAIQLVNYILFIGALYSS